jgi:ABC-type uncharacterized transport system substrate-binding protein
MAVQGARAAGDFAGDRFLGQRIVQGYAKAVAAFRLGLGEAGYVEGRNVEIESRWANEQYDRLPALAAELVSRRVSLIAAASLPAALAAKRATPTIPIVFMIGSDAVEFGLVTSLNRPGGNITGVGSLGTALLVKHLEFLREVAPAAGLTAFLTNAHNPNSDNDAREAERAARALDVKLLRLNVGGEPDLDAAFATLTQQRPGALFVDPDPFFTARPDTLAALTTLHRIAATHYMREFTAAGGLASYVTNFTRSGYRQAGIYAARILKGEKPANLPVQQSTKVELVINLKTAKALGLTVPLSLLARADEVIE